ncbi:MAG: FAD:protein FMN transferase [Pseudomonas sp.]|nr:FAD:protein FMN transferase [Pseudomonas sp.]MDP3845449.1 FAD:protein FMN transferase [Pseudomonas sp.]
MLACLGLLGCGESPLEFGGPTMGSSYSIKYLPAAHGPTVAHAQAATEAILAEVDQQLSTYRNDSLIARFNALPANSCQQLPAEVLGLVRFGEQLSQQSAGAFDMTVEPLLNLWGFGPQARDERVPTASEIAAVRLRVGHQHVRIDGQQLCKDAAVALDFNSIAAGYAVDRIAAKLGELGVGSYLVEVTGEVKAQGQKADGSPWRIAIEAPLDNQQVAQRILPLDGYGISTSGDYHNYFEQDGQHYSHTLDPLTGAPIKHGLAQVSVVDRAVQRADGLSTLLMVLGPERGLAFAEREGIAALFVSRVGPGFVSHSSSAFTRLFGAEQP